MTAFDRFRSCARAVPPAVTPQLQNPAAAVYAQYALHGDDSTIGTDRSGNGRHLGVAQGGMSRDRVPDLRRGFTCFQRPIGLNGGLQRAEDGASMMGSAMTIMVRAYVSNAGVAGPADRPIASLYHPGGAVPWMLAVRVNAGSVVLRVGSSAGYAHGSQNITPGWHVLAARRNAASTSWRVNIDGGSTETFSVPPFASAAGTSLYLVDYANYSGGFVGGLSDFGMYPSELTDAVIAAQAARMLGLS